MQKSGPLILIAVHSNYPAFQKELSYVLDFLNRHPLKPLDCQIELNGTDADINVVYGEMVDKPSKFKIPAQRLIFSNDVIKTTDIYANKFEYKDQEVYAVEDKERFMQPLIADTVFGFDLIETIFFHISRYEEFHATEKDKDDWFMLHERHHFLVINNIEKVPVVDQLVVAFFKAIGLTPQSIPTQYHLSHDIDVLRKFKDPARSIRAGVRSVLNGFGVTKTLKFYDAVRRKQIKDPYDSFDFLFKKDLSHSWSSKIAYVMSGGNSRFDNFYKLGEPNCIKMLEQAQENGYEIGIHPSYNSFRDPSMIKNEVKDLEQRIDATINYSRQHFLKFDFNITPQALLGAGIQYDSTLGYQRKIGFRCGTGYPYYTYDFSTRLSSRLKEIPMVVMDGALLYEHHEDLTKAQNGLNKFLLQNSLNTQITFNIHNTIFDPTKRDVAKLKEVYESIFS